MKIRTIAAAVILTFGLVGSAATASDWANADGSCFQKGNKQITVGFNVFYPGPNVGFEYAFHDAISGGGAVGFNWWGTGYWSYYQIPIVIRAAFHPFNLDVLADKIKVRDKLDVYAGIATGWTVGWGVWDGIGTSPDANIGGFTFRERVGATWYFTPNFYANLEEGSGLGSLNAGVGWKF